MNWYKTIKIAVPLPNVTNEYPERDLATYDLDHYISPDTEERLNKEKTRSYLGHGSFSVAFDIPDGYVEKISSHKDDYRAALQIINEQNIMKGGVLPWVVKVLSAEEIQPRGHEYEEELYGGEKVKYQAPTLYRIIMEKVTPLNKQQIKWFDNRFWHFLNMKTERRKELSNINPLSEEQNKFNKQMIEFANKVDAYDIPTWDIKGFNVGLRNDEIVVLDLGAVQR